LAELQPRSFMNFWNHKELSTASAVVTLGGRHVFFEFSPGMFFLGSMASFTSSGLPVVLVAQRPRVRFEAQNHRYLFGLRRMSETKRCSPTMRRDLAARSPLVRDTQGCVQGFTPMVAASQMCDSPPDEMLPLWLQETMVPGSTAAPPVAPAVAPKSVRPSSLCGRSQAGTQRDRGGTSSGISSGAKDC
jgi:hypothetical protein